MTPRLPIFSPDDLLLIERSAQSIKTKPRRTWVHHVCQTTNSMSDSPMKSTLLSMQKEAFRTANAELHTLIDELPLYIQTIASIHIYTGHFKMGELFHLVFEIQKKIESITARILIGVFAMKLLHEHIVYDVIGEEAGKGDFDTFWDNESNV